MKIKFTFIKIVRLLFYLFFGLMGSYMFIGSFIKSFWGYVPLHDPTFFLGLWFGRAIFLFAVGMSIVMMAKNLRSREKELEEDIGDVEGYIKTNEKEHERLVQLKEKYQQELNQIK